MASPKDVLATTAHVLEGYRQLKHFRPVSAHLVAGTNMFSDFFASFSDVFGGRSNTYKNQLSSLYTDSVEQLKVTAFELGANAIVGLHVDLDEVSGKGKSMFMVTATGTAILIDKSEERLVRTVDEKFENVSVDKIRDLRFRRTLIEKSNQDSLNLDDQTWDFIIDSQVHEVFDFLIRKFKTAVEYAKDSPDQAARFYGRLKSLLELLPDERKIGMLYEQAMKLDDGPVLDKVYQLVAEMNLLDLGKVQAALDHEDFDCQKRALKFLSFDKPFYNIEDIAEFSRLRDLIQVQFPEKYPRSFKKQLLSSKEKEIWTCGCKNTVEIDKRCGSCKTDIFGFKANEIDPPTSLNLLEERVSLISAYLS